MKSITDIHKRTALVLIVLILSILPAFADNDHPHPHHADHGHGTAEKEPGPNGGRIIEGEDFKLEFFVKDDRKVQISFLNDHGEVVSPQDQHISLIGGDRSNPTHLQFEKSGKVLISKDALPKHKNMPTILNVKTSPDANNVRERFNINMSTCPECSLHEYACICGHEELGHSHGPDANHQH